MRALAVDAKTVIRQARRKRLVERGRQLASVLTEFALAAYFAHAIFKQVEWATMVAFLVTWAIFSSIVTLMDPDTRFLRPMPENLELDEELSRELTNRLRGALSKDKDRSIFCWKRIDKISAGTRAWRLANDHIFISSHEFSRLSREALAFMATTTLDKAAAERWWNHLTTYAFGLSAFFLAATLGQWAIPLIALGSGAWFFTTTWSISRIHSRVNRDIIVFDARAVHFLGDSLGARQYLSSCLDSDSPEFMRASVEERLKAINARRD